MFSYSCFFLSYSCLFYLFLFSFFFFLFSFFSLFSSFFCFGARGRYGFDLTATYGSPIEANSSLANAQNLPLGNFSDPWWSAKAGDAIKNHGINWMNASVAAGQPFYLNLWWHMSHDTIDPLPAQMADFPFKSTCLFPATMAGQTVCPSQIYWGAQTNADKTTFAPVIAMLDTLGIRNSTYVIFSTDNGAQTRMFSPGVGAFDNAVGSQGPFRGAKASLYEGGHRVPFIVAGPGVPAGRVDHSLLSAVDWLPTVAALAGAPVPAGTLLRGFDQSDIWLGRRSNVLTRPAPLFFRNAGGPGPCWSRAPALATRNGDWKLLINPDFDAPEPGLPLRVELYNMSVSQLQTNAMNGAFFGEAQNYAGGNEALIAALAAPLLAWHRGVGPVVPNQTDAHLAAACTGCEAYPFPR